MAFILLTLFRLFIEKIVLANVRNYAMESLNHCPSVPGDHGRSAARAYEKYSAILYCFLQTNLEVGP